MKIIIEGDPIPWARPGKGKCGSKRWSYDTQLKEKEVVRWQMKCEWNKHFDIPSSPYGLEANEISNSKELSVGLTFLFSPNKSDGPKLANAKLWGIEEHREKPDWDNLSKFYLDSGNKLLWSDDKILYKAYVRKGHSKKPRTIIEIMTKENLDSKSRKILEIFGPDQLIKFIEDLKKFDFISKEEIRKNSSEGEGDDKLLFQRKAAMLLDEFASNHAKALTQVHKYIIHPFVIHKGPIC